jgi:hypothetical protein
MGTEDFIDKHKDSVVHVLGGMTLWKSWLTLKDIKCQLILASNHEFETHEKAGRLGDRTVFGEIDRERVHYLPRRTDNQFGTDKLILGSSSAHVAVHFAWLIGAKEILLHGCECQYEDGKKHYWQFPDQPDEGLINPDHEELRRPLDKENPGGTTDGELCYHLAIWEQIYNRNRTEMQRVHDRSGGQLGDLLP